ncbi:hypothetical protein B7Y94_03540 [Candidatus Saccharibacteria bacterium 32-49-12]|nr:MAG: hypothetical protein B7Y94_03540 [Candidatus Saccharibacteria bacterium 32-49-12]
MKLSRLLLTIAFVIIGVWLLGLIFRIAAWMINGLLYVAAIAVIIWLVSVFVEQRRNQPKR